MIYTVTFNPSIDYIMYVPDYKYGGISRSEKERIYPGGKGINVSIMLGRMGVETRALGFLAGYTGTIIENMLRRYISEYEFITLENGNSRINVKLKSGQESEINGAGPEITQKAKDELNARVSRIERGDTLVLAGTIPPSLDQSAYRSTISLLKAKGISFVVDATNSLMLNTLEFSPFLIKPNIHELGDMFGENIYNEKDIVKFARKAQQLGAKNVLVSMAGEGAVLVTENGDILTRDTPKGSVVNSVGAGDSMVAGFLAGWQKTGSYEAAMDLGIAAGSATAFCEWLAELDDIQRLLEDPSVYNF